MRKGKGSQRHRMGVIALVCAAALAAGIFLVIRSFPETTPDWESDKVYLLVDAAFDPACVEQLLNAYSDYRADSLREVKTATALGEDLLNGSVALPSGKKGIALTELFGPEVISEEERRQGLIAEMEWSTGRNIVESTWENTIGSQQGSDALIYLKCEIRTVYEYVPFSSSTPSEDEMLTEEFITQHTVTLQKGDSGYRLIADAYEEEPTGMRSASYVDTTR